jgi:hypothetical protein
VRDDTILELLDDLVRLFVSVPLRGKEGAGLFYKIPAATGELFLFPSPCGVRRVRDPWFLETLYDAVFKVRF